MEASSEIDFKAVVEAHSLIIGTLRTAKEVYNPLVNRGVNFDIINNFAAQMSPSRIGPYGSLSPLLNS